jgi:hypothetical protein
MPNCTAATPALTIFFGVAPYESNIEMHEKFWSSHLNRVAKSGFLIGARENGEWLGFRAFFEPGKSRLPYVTDFVSLVLSRMPGDFKKLTVV